MGFLIHSFCYVIDFIYCQKHFIHKHLDESKHKYWRTANNLIIICLWISLFLLFRQAWDLALDLCLRQLPKLLEDETAVFQHSPFFTEQLTAFDVWLKYGAESRAPPEQLPIVLQVLLSQVHRLRALELLGRFLDLGPWAVSLVIFYKHLLSCIYDVS